MRNFHTILKSFQRVSKKGLVIGGGVCVIAYVYPKLKRQNQVAVVSAATMDADKKYAWSPLPTREDMLKSLETEEYDVLVIGGGATGTGVALDATSRGLKTAMVEKYDFSSGTSSRSTKLIHGGVRYLQKAVFNLDLEQYRMVKEALTERANLIEIAPHLAYPFPIMLPIYKYWQIPYFWAGIKMYDFVAGKQKLKSSYYLSKKKALEKFPMLKKEALKGALVYYDGQHDDARMNIAIAISTARMGGSVANYIEVLELHKSKDENGKEVVSGARVKDRITDKEFNIKAKCIINATGPYTDHIRLMGNKDDQKICQPSQGVHIVLPDYYSPEDMGLLDPDTSDGRVIFFLPWQKVTLAGTTDVACEVTDKPSPSENEIQFILSEVRNYLHQDVDVRRGDVLSAWCGIRPLVMDPNKSDTQSIARNHIIEISDNNLITIAGGKWTTYRHMAEETVDKAIDVCNLKTTSGCRTKGLMLDGAHGWSPTLFIRLVQDFGLENEVAKHLASTYGDKAFKVAKLATLTGKRWPVSGKRLHEEFPYLEAEVRYAVREYACRAVDILARRTRLAFCNVHAAEEALPRIIEIMTEELKWSKSRQQAEMEHAKQFLRREMGLDLGAGTSSVPINFTKDEINMYVKRFKSLDYENKGFITVNDLRRYFKKIGERVTEDQLHDILNEVDLNKNAQVDIGEFLQLMSALKSGNVSNSRFAKAVLKSSELDRIPVERSGGGV
ncbi:glycerol-3-phosphate dehydrogenase, mitochondrial-like isoform X1 [Mytilus galloprovincialis]|uniref:glycerol-3-phosphate dehydrogenase, mitochondrial-like isoform X1 n=1 Tax=Mytilus galloprovincialis TaxID=29158 RepID=UPI003F7BC244